MIPNTFKPYFHWITRTKHTHDYFGFGICVCNCIDFSISIWGYGFYVGFYYYDPMKATEKKYGKQDEDYKSIAKGMLCKQKKQ